MATESFERRWRWMVLAAVLVYCLWGGLLILQNPGLQYDEALLVLGSVHMHHSPHQELTLPHDPDTWIRVIRQRWIPLMTVRYVGAVKEYICLPLFALFGSTTQVLRIVSLLLGALGVWGIGVLTARQAGYATGAAAALVLAVHPAYVDLTVFDNGTVSIWMAALGLLCLAISRYLERQDTRAAFWIGVAMGFGVWARANFLWLLIAMALAAVIVLGKRVLVPAAHWGAAVAGGILGGAPFLVYQVHSRGGTWEALSMFSSQVPYWQRLPARLVMLSETLLSDREHRAIWDGPPMPDWQRWLIPAMVGVGCLVCLVLRRGSSLWARAAAWVFLFFGATLLLARQDVAEHHFIALVPLAAVVVACASAMVVARYRWGRGVVAAAAAVYLGSALYWQVSAIGGLGRTGGVGQWSDAVFGLADHLQQKYPDQEIKILDWGLQNNLYIISDGKLRSREIYPDSTQEQSGLHRPWMEEIREGGVFLLNGPSNRQIPAASVGFLEALSDARPVVRRFTVAQRNGAAYAEIVEVAPNSGQYVERKPREADELHGFHQLEAGGWRWTKREFAVTLRSPAQRARLVVQLYIPDSIFQKLGPMTLTARIGSHQLPPETYRQTGRYAFTREVEAGWLAAGRTRVDFALDKCLPPTSSDARELGIVVSSVRLEPR